MSVTMKDIAKKMGLSESTVSLALNDKKTVGEKTKKRVKAVAREMGYLPNIIAQNLANQRSFTFGLIVPDIESAYYAKVVKAVDKIVRKAGYSFVLAISNDDQEVEEKIINSFISQRVEGILIAPVNKDVTKISHFNNLKLRGIPFVFITAFYDIKDALYVMSDLEEGSYKMVNYLFDLGHKNILFMGGEMNNISSAYRIKGYRKAHDERGLPINKERIIQCDELNYERAQQALERLIVDNFDFTAIVTINDEMALAVINTLKNNHIDVPGRVSVGGYDNTIFSRVSSVPITTVSQGITDLCAKAVNMLLKVLNKEDVIETRINTRPELIVRESTIRRNI